MPNIEDWKSQIKRGTLEYCIMLMMEQRPQIGRASCRERVFVRV